MVARILLAGSALALALALSQDKKDTAQKFQESRHIQGKKVVASVDAGTNASGSSIAGASVDAAFQEAAMAGCIRKPINYDVFMEQYGRSRLPFEEYNMRANLFTERQRAIREHNCAALKSDGPLWTASINHLSDWTQPELMKLRGHKPQRRSNAASVAQLPTFLANRGSIKRRTFPGEFSWANLSTIAMRSEDQGDCGSCWAVASGVVMRARAEIKGLPHKFSTDQMIACTLNPHKCGGTGGCDGATAELAFEYVLREGLVTREKYRELSSTPHTTLSKGVSEMKCPRSLAVSTEVATKGVSRADGSEVHILGTEKQLKGGNIGMRGWTKLPENREEPIMRSLMEDGPLYVAVAVGDHWHYYSGGVMTQEGCDPHNVINHAVTLYAWGIKEKTRIGPVKYWNIKNSWGAHWGEDGNVRLHRKDEEEKRCGWDTNPQEGNGCDGGPKQVWVCGVCGILYDAVAPHF